MSWRPDADVIVCGMGSAGLLAAIEIARRTPADQVADRVLVTGRMSGGASVLSSWYVAQYDPARLYARLVGGLGNAPSDEHLKLIRYLADHHVQETERFKAEVVENAGVGGVKEFVDGFSGIKALTGFSTRQSLPGAKILRYLRGELDRCGVPRVVGTIEGFERAPQGYRVHLSSQRGPSVLACRRLVIASGGLAHTQQVATSARTDVSNVLELVRDQLNVEIRDLHRAVYFPFALREPGYRDGSLLPPSFMTRADIWEVRADGSRHDPLSDRLKAAVASGDYRPVFPELVELFQRLRDGGSEVVVETRMSERELEEYKANDHYGYVFKDKTYAQARRLNIAPAYHTALGGIVIDSQCRSSDPNVFAVGEAAYVYGMDRPIGGEHVSAITLAPVVARAIVEDERAAGAPLELRPFDRLARARRELDLVDDRLVSVLVRAYATRSIGVSGGESVIEEIVRAVFARVAGQATSDRLGWHLRNPEVEDLREVAAEYGVPRASCSPAWPRADLLRFLANLSGAERDCLIETLADRLIVVLPIAQEKCARGLPIRDPARELDVVRRAASRAQDADRAPLVEAVYRGLVLPMAFVFQTLVRRSADAPRSAPL